MKIIYSISILLLIHTHLYTQDTNILIENKFKQQKLPSIRYRPGLNFETSSLNEHSSRQNFINSPSIRIESGNTGRFGNIRVDGAVTKPMLGIDGFIVRDVSINEGQILLDMLPYDFAEKVDIYKQNLTPFGINAGSFIDFQIPVKNFDYVKIYLQGTSIGGFYLKLQGEKRFRDGSSVYGVVGDFGLMDYYYGINSGQGFDFYKGSTYQRASFLSKTIWKNIEFLIANTIYNGFNEGGGKKEPSCKIMRNNLILGMKYKKDIISLKMNYTFLNQYIQPYNKDSISINTHKLVVNDYLNHHFIATISISDYVDRYYYNIVIGYENRSVHDGQRANISNYKSVPKYGENDFNLVTEFGISLFKESDDPYFNIDFNFSMNQILTSFGYYTPIPSFSIGIRHNKGINFGMHLSRVYIIPDITSAYSFGQVLPNIQVNPKLLPKDGVKTGISISYDDIFWRIYANASYAWLNASFKVTDQSMVENVFNVTSISLEIGSEYKYITNNIILIYKIGLGYNFEIDKYGSYINPIPIWKFINSLTIYPIDKVWQIQLLYRLEACIPNKSYLDTRPRHFLDFNTKYKFFIFNIVNLLNQSYLPQPDNIYYPVNPGIRAELGLQFEF